MTVTIDYSGGVFSAKPSGSKVGTITAPAGDEHFSNVTLLLNGSGTSGSTSITDISSNPKTISINGNTQVNTTVKKHGTGSIEFDGTNSNITVPSGTIGSGDFTIEYYVNSNINSGAHLDFNGTNRLYMYYKASSTTSAKPYSLNVYYLPAGNQGQNNSFPQSTYVNNWTHVAVVRNSNTVTVYINGSSKFSFGNSLDYTDASLTIGSSNTSGNWVDGYLDDIRITNGVARYTSSFYPPTEALNQAPIAGLNISSGNYFNYIPSANTTFEFNNAPASGTALDFTLKVTGANVITGYDIANATNDNVAYDYSAQGLDSGQLHFSPDGTKMFIAGLASDSINEYTLSTAFDITTASYIQRKNVYSEESALFGASFNPAGTKMYITGHVGDDVVEYDLSTGFDVSTAVFGRRLYIGGTPREITWKPDGTKFFITYAQGSVKEWDLTTAYDVTTGTAGSSFSIGNNMTASATAFSPDGTQMFVLRTDSPGPQINKYFLLTPWSVSSAYFGESLTIASLDTGLGGLAFNPDGSKMFILGAGQGNVYQFSSGISSVGTISYPSSIKWSGGIAPAAPEVGETDALTFYTTDGGSTYYGFQTGDNYS